MAPTSPRDQASKLLSVAAGSGYMAGWRVDGVLEKYKLHVHGGLRYDFDLLCYLKES